MSDEPLTIADVGVRGRTTPALWVGLVALVLVFPLFASEISLYLAASTLLVAASATSLNLVLGYVGILTMGHAALLATGAFAAGLAGAEAGLPFLLVLLVAGAVAGIVGFSVALVSLRWRGIYVVLGTLALHFIALFALARIQDARVGPIGFRMPVPSLAGISINSDRRWYYVLAVFAAANIACVALLTRSHIGRAWVAARHNPLAASALGVNLTRSMVLGFTIGSVLTGLAGAVGAYFARAVSHETFTLGLTIQYLSIVLIGGAGTLTGGLLGAIFYSALPYLVNSSLERVPEGWTSLKGHAFSIQNALFGVTIVAVMLFEPGGIAHGVGRIARAVTGRFRGSRSREKSPGPGPSVVGEPPTTGLIVEAMEVTYRGTIRAVQGVDLRLEPGEVVGVIGANGAGKTSMLRGITGFVAAEHATVRGRVWVDGRPILGLPPYRVAAKGVVSVPERDKVFTELSVADNLTIVHTRSGAFGIDEILELFPPLAARWRERAGFLSGGEKQMLALARALHTGPRYLLIDEPSQGLAPRMLLELVAALKAIRGHDLGILLVDENPNVLTELADRIYAMETGRIVFEGPAEALTKDAMLRAIYLGVDASPKAEP